jgi:hypothetical protein
LTTKYIIKATSFQNCSNRKYFQLNQHKIFNCKHFSLLSIKLNPYDYKKYHQMFYYAIMKNNLQLIKILHNVYKNIHCPLYLEYVLSLYVSQLNNPKVSVKILQYRYKSNQQKKINEKF